MQKHLPLLPFFCTPFGGFCTHHGRSPLPRPTHRSFLTVHTHILSVYFSDFRPFIVYGLHLVSIALRLEFVCTSFHHTYATHPGSGFDPARGCGWFFLGSVLRVVQSSRADERCAFVRFTLCSACLGDGRPLTRFR